MYRPIHIQERNYFIREVYNYLNVQFRPPGEPNFLTPKQLFMTLLLQHHKFSFLLGRTENNQNSNNGKGHEGKKERSYCVIKRELEKVVRDGLKIDNERDWSQLHVNFNIFQLFLLSSLGAGDDNSVSDADNNCGSSNSSSSSNRDYNAQAKILALGDLDAYVNIYKEMNDGEIATNAQTNQNIIEKDQIAENANEIGTISNGQVPNNVGITTNVYQGRRDGNGKRKTSVI